MKNFQILLLASVVLSSCNRNTNTDSQPLGSVESFESPAGANSSLPYLVTGDDNELYLSWIEKNSDTASFKFASLIDDHWSSVEEIAKGTDWFVNWADYPMMSVNHKGEKLAHFLAKSTSGTYSYDVNIVRNIIGDQWSAPLIPHLDQTPTEHGFVTMLPLENGAFQLAWLDGRNTVGGHEMGEGGAMTFRTAIMDTEGMIIEGQELDNRTCDCCQTGGALTDNGPIFVYRDRSALEIRDISIVRKIGSEWTAPEAVFPDQWEIKGCPVNGPKADVIGNNLVVVWFTAAKSNPQVKAIFSEDGGASFGKMIVIDNKNPLGRVDVILTEENRAIVSWLAQKNNKTIIRAVAINKNGEVGQPVQVTETSEERSSGFPQMEKYGNSIFFAWTSLQNEKSKVQLARIKIEDLVIATPN